MAASLWVAFLAALTDGQAQHIAQARLNCLSLRFQRATAAGLGPDYTLDLSSLAPQEPPNGEFYPLFDPLDFSHASNFILNDPSMGPVPGNLAFDVPLLRDSNTNQIPDFFETNLGIEATTTEGDYATPVDQGTIKATWTRLAGSSLGSCRFQLISRPFGALPEYTASFEVLEYAGLLSYTPSKSTVKGILTLTNVQNSSDAITGPVTLAKTLTNGVVELLMASGRWTNSAGQALAHIFSTLEPFPRNHLNYSGYVQFIDFDPNTAGEDYFDWILILNDPNDSDGDGIPDLSDDPSAPPAARLELQLEIDRARKTMSFKITGPLGRTATLQGNEYLDSTNWMDLNAVTFTNVSHVLEMALPDSPMMFYRLRMN